MALLVHCGTGGSGKSLFAIQDNIIPALAAGRRVVTNIEGMGSEERKAKLFELVAKRGFTGEPDFHFVGHSDLNAGLVFPRDMGCEDADGTRQFDDSECIAKFGTLLVWDEAQAFEKDNLKPIWRQAITYHRHWARTGSPFDILLIHQNFPSLAPLVRGMTEICRWYVRTGKKEVAHRYTFNTPGDVSKLNRHGRNVLRETVRHNPAVYATYKSNLAEGAVNDAVQIPLWKTKWARKMAAICLALVAMSVAGMMVVGPKFRAMSGGQTLSGKPEAAEGNAPPAVASNKVNPPSAGPQIVGKVPTATGTVAMVKDGENFVEVAPDAAGRVVYNGRALQWPVGW